MRDIPYGRQTITDADIAAVENVLRSDFLTQGPKLGEFEKKFADYVGAPYAVTVMNATAGLHLAAMVMGVRPGQKVITTPITFSASANCIRYCGGDVAFADIDPETYLLDLESVRKLLESHPRGTFAGVIPVSFAGLPQDLYALRQLADEYGLWIIEDACHAPGAAFTVFNGQKFRCGDGRLADISVFSFHPVKHIACGEGGMLTTTKPELYQRLQHLRSHGITRDTAQMNENHGPWYYEIDELGFNFRMTEMQAALGISQLGRAEEGLRRRREIASRYDQAFRGTSIRVPSVPKGFEHAWHLYVIQVENREKLFHHLREAKIFAQVHYIPVYWLPYYQRIGFQKGLCPVAEAYYQRCLSLPMFPGLTEQEQEFVIDSVLEGSRT